MQKYSVEFKVTNISQKKYIVAITREMEEMAKIYKVDLETTLNPDKKEETNV